LQLTVIAFINRLKGYGISKEEKMHTTLDQIGLLAQEVMECLRNSTSYDKVHRDLARIVELAKDADDNPAEYARVLLRELIVKAKADETARCGLETALAQVPLVLIKGDRQTPITLGDLVEGPDGLVELELCLGLGRDASRQLKLVG